jgi:hypothetical protein
MLNGSLAGILNMAFAYQKEPQAQIAHAPGA